MRNLEENRIPGTNFDEILYADDTLVISQDTRTLNLFIETLQTEGEQIGLQLNKHKTELLILGKSKVANVKFKDGAPIKK